MEEGTLKYPTTGSQEPWLTTGQERATPHPGWVFTAFIVIRNVSCKMNVRNVGDPRIRSFFPFSGQLRAA